MIKEFLISVLHYFVDITTAVLIAAAVPCAADAKTAPDIHLAEAVLPKETGILQN